MAMCREHDVKAIDLRFMDFPGLWQHFSVPAREVDEGTFESGLGFDGSSIRGWQAINESDMLVKPVPETADVARFYGDVTGRLAALPGVTRVEQYRNPLVSVPRAFGMTW